MNCENCLEHHEGFFGSGRFCSKKCSSSYSTKSKRLEINEKVSKVLKGRKPTGSSFKKGFDDRRKIFTAEEQILAVATRLKNIENFYRIATWEELPLAEKRRRVLSKQDGKCLKCGTGSIWQNEKILLELDHINGNNKDNSEHNLRFLCPNCHSQTPTFRNRRRF